MGLFQREAWTFTTNGKRAIWLLVVMSSVVVMQMPSFPEQWKAALYNLVLHNKAFPVLLVLYPALWAVLTRTRLGDGAAGALQHARIQELSRRLWIRTSLGFLLVFLVVLSNSPARSGALVVALALSVHLEMQISQPLRAAKKELTARREASLAPRKVEDIVPRAAWGLAWAGWLMAVAFAAAGTMEGGDWPALDHRIVMPFIFTASQLALGPFLARYAIQRPESTTWRHPVRLRRVKAWGTYCLVLSYTVPLTIGALAMARGWASGPWFGLAIPAACIVSLSIGAAGHHLQQPQNPGEP